MDDDRYRLIGTRQVETGRSDPTGRYADETLQPAARDLSLSLMLAAVERRRPQYGQVTSPLPRLAHLDSERVHFPLASDGDTVDMLATLHAYALEARG